MAQCIIADKIKVFLIKTFSLEAKTNSYANLARSSASKLS